MTTNTWLNARNVLAVRLDSMGDVLMTTPAIRALKDQRSGRRITLLTSSSGAAIGRLVPEIDAVIEYDAPWLKATTPRLDSAPDLSMVQRLRDQHFDAAVIFTVFSQSPLPAALLCHLAGIPLRIARCRENPYQLLSTWLPEDEPHQQLRHEVQRQLDLISSIGATTPRELISLAVPDEARERVDALLAEIGLHPDEPWLVLHPGASAESRRYPEEMFAAAAFRLATEDGCRVLVTGSDDERPLAQSLSNAIPDGVSLAGMMDLSEMAALIERAPVLITNNTGPAHMAAALNTPVVDVYAGTNPQHAPWRTPFRLLTAPVPCAPCFKSVCPQGHLACLRGISPNDVVHAARELLYAPLSEPRWGDGA